MLVHKEMWKATEAIQPKLKLLLFLFLLLDASFFQILQLKYNVYYSEIR